MIIRVLFGLFCAWFAASGALADTEVHLDQSAQKTVSRDRLRADLRAEAQGTDSRAVQDEVNRKMGAALAAARKVSGVTVQSGGYSVYRDQDPKSAQLWHASQGITLISKDFDTILKLCGDLQGDGLLMSGLRFFLAPETLRGAQSELTAQALSGLKDRAAEIAADLGMEVKQIKQIMVGNAVEGFDGPRPMMRMAAPAAITPVTPPDAQAGDSTISVQVTAELVLGDKGK